MSRLQTCPYPRKCCAPRCVKSHFSPFLSIHSQPTLNDLLLLLLLLHGLLCLLCCRPALTPSLFAAADRFSFPDLLLLLASIPPVICCRLFPPAFSFICSWWWASWQFCHHLAASSLLSCPISNSALSYQQQRLVASAKYPLPLLHLTVPHLHSLLQPTILASSVPLPPHLCVLPATVRTFDLPHLFCLILAVAALDVFFH